MVECDKFLSDQFRVVLLVCWTNFIVFATFTVPSPFLPKYLQDRGVIEFMIGLIFGVSELVIFFLSPIVGKYLYLATYKKALLFGYVLCLIPVASFSLLPLINGSLQTTIFGLSLRILTGVAGSILETVTFAYLISVTPQDELGYYFGWSEVSTGLGAMLGPPMGGFLFEYCGIQLTYIINAILLALPIAPIAIYLNVSTEQSNSSDPIPFSTVLKIPWLWIIAITSTLAIATTTVLDSTLQIHLSKLSLSPLYVGLMFLAPAFFYMIGGPIFGSFQGWIGGKSLCILGFVLEAIGFCLLGPYPEGWLVNSVWSNLVGLILIGLGVCLVIIPGVALLSEETSHLGDRVTDILSGLLPSFYALGAFVGPLFGSGLSQYFGTTLTYGVLAGVCASMVLVLFVVSMIDFWGWRKRRIIERININKE